MKEKLCERVRGNEIGCDRVIEREGERDEGRGN